MLRHSSVSSALLFRSVLQDDVIKYRVNFGHEFVIGGFTPGPHGLDAIIFVTIVAMS